MTASPRATEIPELVRRLGSRNRPRVDAARARLAIIGARAVEALIESLDGDNDRVRARAMQLLALIRDPRGREPLTVMLLDRNPRMREIAAGCLGPFPSPEASAALDRLLGRENRREVRVAAVRALLEQYVAGIEPAIRPVLELLSDPTEDPAAREAALALLPLLRASERRSILRRLRKDPAPTVRRRVEALEARGFEEGRRQVPLDRWLSDLESPNYAVWNEAVQSLAALGAAAVEPLVRAMERRAHDPEYCTRGGMALKAMGPRRARSVADELDRVDDPMVLQVLVEVVGALGEKSLIYRLSDLIQRIAERPVRPGPDGFDPMQRVRAKAHLELARIGSRVAIADLRETLHRREGRLELEVLAAVERIGKRDEIGELLRRYPLEDGFIQERLAQAVRTIMKRERIRRNNPVFQSLSDGQRRVLEKMLPPPRKRAKRGGGNRRLPR